MSVITEHISPPIPIRSHDWRAWDDEVDPEIGLSGWGATEVEAVNDLMGKLDFIPQPEPKYRFLAP